MTNRREFLHMGVAALSLPIAARAGVPQELLTASDEQEAKAQPLYKVFFDERFAACGTFAEELKERGVATRAIRGDITDVWFNDLYHVWKEARWKQEPAAIAGMTAPGPIFCLDMLGREAGMRVVLRVDHRFGSGTQAESTGPMREWRVPESRIEHEFWGPEDLLTRTAELHGNQERWPDRMAELVARFPAETRRMAARRYSGEDRSDRHNPHHLVTWVIAPVSKGGSQGAPTTTRRAAV